MADENAMLSIFDQLKKQAGDKEFLFLGRRVTQDMTFDDVLNTIPLGELETASTVAKALSARAWSKLITPPKSTGQLPIYRAGALAAQTQGIVKQESKPAPESPADSEKGFLGFVSEAMLGSGEYNRNVERYLADKSNPVAVRAWVSGVHATSQALDALIKGDFAGALNALQTGLNLDRSPLDDALDRAQQQELAALNQRAANKRPRVLPKGNPRVINGHVRLW